MTEQAYLDWNATAPLRPEARAAVLAALEAGRQSVLGAWRRPRARAGWSRRRASRSRRWSALMPREVIFTSGGTEANVLALVARARRRAAGFGDRASFGAQRRPVSRRSRRSRSRPTGVVDLDALERRLAGVIAAAGLDHARQQRDRRDPAGRAGGRDRACGGRPAACRCGAGAGPDRLRFQGARRRSDDAVGAQDRRPAGRRRADQARRRSIWSR